MTPVSSPTPDEQAAEEAAVAAFAKACEVLGRTPYKTGGRWCIELACDETRDEVRPVIHAAVAAALVVVREQLTQAQAENSTLREDYARLLSRWDDEREARIRAEGPAARWCEMPRTHEPHLWTCDGETTLCPGYHPSPPTYTTEGPTPPS